MKGAIFGALLRWIVGLFLAKGPAPTAEERAGRAEAQLEAERNAHAIEEQADAARAAAERSVRGEGGNGAVVTSDPDAAINRNPHGHYRD